MQISFDPFQQEEAAAVRAMLDALHAQQVGYSASADAFDESVRAIRNGDVTVSDTREIARLNDLGMALNDPLGGIPPSAAPLAPPAPSTAAADLFSTAPAAPLATSATIVPAPPVPSAPIPPAPSAPAASPSPADVDNTGLPWDERIHSGTKAKNADGTWRARRGLNNPALVKEVEAELRMLAGIPVSAGPLSPPATAPTPAANAEAQAVPITASASAAMVPAAPIVTAPADGTGTTTSHAPVPPAPPIPSPPTPVTTAADTGSAISTTVATSANAPTVTAPAAPTSELPNAATTTSAPPTAPIPSPPAGDASQAQPTAPVTFGALMTKLAKAVNERRITAEQVDEIVARHGIPKGGMGQLVGKLDLVQLIDTEATLLGA